MDPLDDHADRTRRSPLRRELVVTNLQLGRRPQRVVNRRHPRPKLGLRHGRLLPHGVATSPHAAAARAVVATELAAQRERRLLFCRPLAARAL